MAAMTSSATSLARTQHVGRCRTAKPPGPASLAAAHIYAHKRKVGHSALNQLVDRLTVVRRQHSGKTASHSSIWLANSRVSDNNALHFTDGGNDFVRRQRYSVGFRTLAAIAAGAASVSFAAPVATAADGPFAELIGTWGGSGVAKFESGKKESLRCKGYYTDTGGPHKLGISIRCANASAKVELRASLIDSGGAISGTWEERTYNQSGSVTGHATANRLNLSISGGITGSMIVTVSHKSHSVAVITSGPSLKGINISMSR